MANLREIGGINKEVLELLEAAGFIDTRSFVENDAEVIYTELVKANSMLHILSIVPSIEELESLRATLIRPAQYKTIGEDELSELDDETEVRKRSFAIPLSAKFIEKHSVQVESLPVLDCSDSEKQDSNKPTMEVQSMDHFRENGSEIQPLERKPENGSVRSVSTSTNEGIDPSSARYIRGVMHSDPQGAYTGAVAYLFTIVLLILSVIPVVFIVFETEMYMWGLLAPALVILAILLYVSTARKTLCPVCRQRQFVPKSCRKHKKSHTFPLLGYLLPTALHLVFYKWFRCMFCGTSIRVKQ